VSNKSLLSGSSCTKENYVCYVDNMFVLASVCM